MTTNKSSAFATLAFCLAATGALAQVDTVSIYDQPPVPISDITGDGIADVAILYPTEETNGFIEFRNGLSDALIHTQQGGAADLLYGAVVSAVNDVNGDGQSEIAIFSLRNTTDGVPLGVVYFISPVDWQVVAFCTANSSGLTGWVSSDINRSGTVDAVDLISLIEAQMATDGSTLPPIHNDPNGDGRLDISDISKVITDLGVSNSSDSLGVFPLGIAAAGEFVVSDSFVGFATDGNPPTEMGIIGCAWCWVSCWGTLSDAWDCVWQCRAAQNACFDLLDPWEMAECLRLSRLHCIPECLQLLAEVVGDCGKCIIKCGPQPRL